jgi:hypothetical protein
VIAAAQVAYHISNPAAYSVDPTGIPPQIESVPILHLVLLSPQTSLRAKLHPHATPARYFNEESLREFINFRPKDNNGILQRFVQPIGRNNRYPSPAKSATPYP